MNELSVSISYNVFFQLSHACHDEFEFLRKKFTDKQELIRGKILVSLQFYKFWVIFHCDKLYNYPIKKIEEYIYNFEIFWITTFRDDKIFLR